MSENNKPQVVPSGLFKRTFPEVKWDPKTRTGWKSNTQGIYEYFENGEKIPWWRSPAAERGIKGTFNSIKDAPLWKHLNESVRYIGEAEQLKGETAVEQGKVITSGLNVLQDSDLICFPKALEDYGECMTRGEYYRRVNEDMSAHFGSIGVQGGDE